MPFLATWMDLVIIILSEVNQREKAKYYTILFICGIYKQNKTKQNKNKCTHLQSRSRFTDRNKHCYQREKGEGKLEIWYTDTHQCM